MTQIRGSQVAWRIGAGFVAMLALGPSGGCATAGSDVPPAAASPAVPPPAPAVAAPAPAPPPAPGPLFDRLDRTAWMYASMSHSV